MRINLKRRLYGTNANDTNTRRKILDHLINEFCDEYDLYYKDMIEYFSKDSTHLSVLQQYLVNKGYQVSTYSFNGVGDIVLSWGLEFNQDCNLTLALKLRYFNQEDNK